MEHYFTYLRQLNLASMMLRIFLAMLMGGLIGLDRERKNRPAGFRTYMLVALAAASTQILSQYLDLMLDTQWADAFAVVGRRTDVVRLGARIVSGVGFIGTGTILLTERQEVKGLTTASCLWASACMGLAIGAGFYECVIVGTILIVLVMELFPLVDDNILATSRNMNFYVEMDSIEYLGAVVNCVKGRDIRIYDVDIGKVEQNGEQHVSGLFSVKLPKRGPHTELLATIATIDGIVAIEEV
ncbi:MAG: MgtC/SapB family protein [Oscillospiraceae bacterium]|nr:MgtC/SapB family protein [Oscillospiraceae bacterium]